MHGGECTGRWWIEQLDDEAPQEVSDIARQALTRSTVSTTELEGWKETIDGSKSGEREIPAHKLEGYAYMEAVRGDVRAELQAAGHHDQFSRIVEVHYESECDKIS